MVYARLWIVFVVIWSFVIVRAFAKRPYTTRCKRDVTFSLFCGIYCRGVWYTPYCKWTLIVIVCAFVIVRAFAKRPYTMKYLSFLVIRLSSFVIRHSSLVIIILPISFCSQSRHWAIFFPCAGLLNRLNRCCKEVCWGILQLRACLLWALTKYR